TTIRLPGSRIAIDFRGERRGIFLKDGTPLAFFRPDYREQGYQSKEEEMRDWRSGKVAEYLA
ncbi:MAG: hypothetical protein J0L97_11160, partial [Alphaproteobacteria bacterium]|nr:hypothetical protein [Alphaproteobacteria bacterium]